MDYINHSMIFLRFKSALLFVCSALLCGLGLFVATPTPVYAQGGCDPATIEVLGVPPALSLYYANVTRNNNQLYVDENGQVVFQVDSAWIGTSSYVGPTGRVGIQNTNYLNAITDPAKDYTLFVEVLDFSIVGNLHATYPRISLLNGANIGVLGVYTFTVDGAAPPSTLDLLYLQVNSTTPRDSIEVQGAWRLTLLPQGCSLPEPPEPPEPSLFCPDGYELLEEPVPLTVGSPWLASVDAPFERLAVRYTFSDSGPVGVLHYLDMRINEEKITRRFYSDEMRIWDPVTGWDLQGIYSFMVPNINDPSYRSDYDPAAYAEGPDAELYVTTGYNPLNLISVCVIPILTSELCEDGIEMIQEPVYLSSAGGMWEGRLDDASGITHFVVRYTVENPTPGGTIDPSMVVGKFMPQIQTNFYYVEATFRNEITFTLPTTGELRLFDDYIFLRFYNRYDAVLLSSVCIIDLATEDLLQLTAEDCNLNNPDFVTAPDADTDWTTEGSVAWHADEANGVVHMENAGIYQNPLYDRGKVWEVEVRARGDGELLFGTGRSALLDRGPQLMTVDLEPTFRLYRNSVFMMPTDWTTVIADGDYGTVDYVCLLERTGGIFDVPDCGDTPVWNPEGSGDPLLIYLFKFLADTIRWGICEILQFLAIWANSIAMALEDILMRIPALPNVLADNFWAELITFLRLAMEGFTDWLLQFFFPDMQDWLADLINNIVRWFAWQFRRFGQWLSWLAYDVILWLSEQLGVTPQAIYDALYDLGYEARLFWIAIRQEIEAELVNALHLLINTGDVLIILASGVRDGVSGNQIAYIGSDFTGIGGFIWDGVDFVNEVVDLTPLSALNVLALGVIAFGMMAWTGKKFLRMLEAFS